MITTQHGNLVDTESGGNGYHGRCEFCGLPCVTDLGYSSWEGTKCIEHEKMEWSKIASYCAFFGLRRSTVMGVTKYIKSYSDVEYTELELQHKIDKIMSTV